MTDTITLPREVAEYLMETMEELSQSKDWYWSERDKVALPALRKALAAEQPKQEAKQEPVAYFDLQKQVFFWAKPTQIDVPMTIALEPLPLYTAPPDAEALRRDAERWRFYEAAGSNLTLRLHNTRSDHRNAAIDAAMGDKT